MQVALPVISIGGGEATLSHNLYSTQCAEVPDMNLLLKVTPELTSSALGDQVMTLLSATIELPLRLQRTAPMSNQKAVTHRSLLSCITSWHRIKRAIPLPPEMLR